ncbi:hypothetical protein EIN_368150 [Entamoeba invadens IP1]|uniref:Leucine rich repeat containing protein BspA family protein n=1 Tax=Entamoeba invadens IP1 TaxID=370355 RepID=A0A0A1U740_ENTIV|nr:hypothetical protein EIN_368150 [Entamoeba invadens IP1]ELP88817.1 hypothetical protein EIN_368150 [Entamoeba invadens IP1]|eukprot:XP_004255588.1 hypothetical protein EIN_368150 [Entamoeba invadens IP1]
MSQRAIRNELLKKEETILGKYHIHPSYPKFPSFPQPPEPNYFFIKTSVKLPPSHLGLSHLFEIGFYLKSARDFIHIMFTCKKFRLFTNEYTEFNPIDDFTIFPLIKNQYFYFELSDYTDPRCFRKKPGMVKYVYYPEVSYTESLWLYYKVNLECPNVVYSGADYIRFGFIIPKHIHRMGDACFYSSPPRGLQSYTIPDHIWKLGQMAFKRCTNITEIICAKTNLYIPSLAFALDKNVMRVVLNGIDSLPQGLFAYCEKLTEVQIPTTVSYLSNFCFTGCKSLPEIHIPSIVTSIGFNSFEECLELTYVNLPDHIKEIPDYSFADCKSLVELKLPSKITRIGNAAFAFSAKLQSINIPSTVTYVGESCFLCCSQLVNIAEDIKNVKVKENFCTLTVANEDRIKLNNMKFIQELEAANSSDLEKMDWSSLRKYQ